MGKRGASLKVRIAIFGSTGRMGQAIQEVASGSSDPDSGQEIVARAYSSSPPSELEKLFTADVVVDFTGKSGLESLLGLYGERLDRGERVPALVTGSTGYTSEVRDRLEELALRVPVLASPNFSLGIYLVQKALRSWNGNEALNRFRCSIYDLHHHRKVDAPSGTALLLQDSLGGEAPIESQREGEVIGEHVVRLSSPFESIQLRHEVHDRKVFAEGALRVAREMASRRENLPKRLLTLDDLFV